ncbi:MAG: polysaccharide deacetylase family protein [Polyangiaceae bacterium]
MGDLRVYVYHGIVDRKIDSYLERNFHLASEFRAQLEAMKHTRFLDVDEFERELERPQGGKRDAALITFDDGYANNLDAARILRRLGIPWVLFATSGAIGRRNTIWTVELSLLLLHGRAKTFSLFGKRWRLDSAQDRFISFEAIRHFMKSLPSERCHAAMTKLRSAFPDGETNRLLKRFPSMRSLSWVELRQLSDDGVTVGSHGVRHDIHHDGQPRSTRLYELAESATVLSKRLRKKCDTFAYPNGDHTATSGRLVASAGYRLAFTTVPRSVLPGTHRLMIPRCELPKAHP